MDPFNIVIRNHGEQLDLNIHPEPGNCFKVVFNGGLLGELRLGAKGWVAVSADEIDARGHSVYDYNGDSGYADLLMDRKVVERIGEEIDQVTGRSSV